MIQLSGLRYHSLTSSSILFNPLVRNYVNYIMSHNHEKYQKLN
uniref:Uncharacterized protein n=1 Tax=Anguilla anguilla TaxID=7936 RepID=A0A0E9QKH7_ANGAN